MSENLQYLLVYVMCDDDVKSRGSAILESKFVQNVRKPFEITVKYSISITLFSKTIKR